MATVDSTGRPTLQAVIAALDQAIDSAVADRPTHKSGTTFIPADVQASSVARPYVVVHSDGTERSHPDRHWMWLAIAATVTVVLFGRTSVKH